MQENHDIYFQYCLQLAQRSASVKTNPRVGALLRYQEQIIGEGWHKTFGKAHAEVNAIGNVPDHLKHLIPQSTLYVSLEPCNHYGKTAPCTELIIQNGIKKVMVGCPDPNEKMSGKSMDYLRKEGVDVQWAENPNSFLELIRPFAVQQKYKRPYIILKWAESRDGFIGQIGQKIKISNEISDTLVHKWRSEINGILIGHRTLINDRPQLNVRHWTGHSPEKLVFTHQSKHEGFTSIPFAGCTMNQSLEKLLREHHCGTLLVEGGRECLQYFIDQKLWDELRLVKNHALSLENGIQGPFLRGILENRFHFGTDDWFIIRPNAA